MLIDAGADVTQARSDGAAPLHIACIRGRAAVVTILIDAGAGVNQAAITGLRCSPPSSTATPISSQR